MDSNDALYIALAKIYGLDYLLKAIFDDLKKKQIAHEQRVSPLPIKQKIAKNG